MLRLTNRYAAALLEFAKERGLGEIYRQALLLVVNKREEIIPSELEGDLGEYLRQIPPKEVTGVVYRFLDLAREELDMIPVEIISAVPLRQDQLQMIEERLIRLFRKQMEITATVDPSILGGLRIIVGNTVLDSTIKRQLSDMKESVYKGVYVNR